MKSNQSDLFESQESVKLTWKNWLKLTNYQEIITFTTSKILRLPVQSFPGKDLFYSKEATYKVGQKEFIIKAVKNSGLANSVNLLTWSGIQSITCHTVLPVMHVALLTFIVNPATDPSTVYTVMKNFLIVVNQLEKEHLSVFAKKVFIGFFWISVLNDLRSFENLFLWWEIPQDKMRSSLYTPYPIFPVRCAPVASSVKKFAETASLVPNYVFLTNNRINFLHRSLSPVIFGKIRGPHWNKVFWAWS